jgi:hypothetical protein
MTNVMDDFRQVVIVTGLTQTSRPPGHPVPCTTQHRVMQATCTGPVAQTVPGPFS